MKYTPQIGEWFLKAEQKALATTGRHGLNVVPVSSIRVTDGRIWLMNYFFRKTRENVLDDQAVALVGWKGFEGYQVKGRATYVESGSDFEDAAAWVAANVPGRVLKGAVIIDPDEAFNIAPGAVQT